MNKVRAKKHLGQHFLKSDRIAENIVNALKNTSDYKQVLEIGPGMGILTKFLVHKTDVSIHLIDIDTESITYLLKAFPQLNGKIIEGDFLAFDFNHYFKGAPYGLIGNFPYNISSQILFKVFYERAMIPEVVGMFQKEVAERVASGPGNKNYGILSVLLQAFYEIEYLFTVEETEFDPPPKVKSGVIRLVRLSTPRIDCNVDHFKSLVKLAFNQRRKTLRNSLKSLLKEGDKEMELLSKRPEQLKVEEFSLLTKLLMGS